MSEEAESVRLPLSDLHTELVREYSDQLKRLLEAVDDGSADKVSLSIYALSESG